MEDVTTVDAGVAPDSPTDTTAAPFDQKKVEKTFKAAAEASKRMRRTHFSEWKGNIERRIGRTATLFTGGVRVDDAVNQSEVNPDWSLTKTKTANLFSQVPAVQITHENKKYAPAIPPFAKALNYELGEKRANVGVPMEEVLNDVVNASGIAAVRVGYAARFETLQVPAIDTSQIPPEVLQQLQAAGKIPMTDAQRVASYKFFCSRISPIDLLVPVEFTGSNFDDGDWVGATGKLHWAEAKGEFKLTDDQKQSALGANDNPTQDSLREDTESRALLTGDLVKYDELYYWRYRVDPDEKSFTSIWRIVFVHGIDEPVIHEPWTGQRLVEGSSKYVGSCRFPIRILTLTYISDNPIPPSDTSAGRPQVDDLRRSRNQMFKNRERSIPIRWFDVNRVDLDIQEQLMRGEWQGMIPTNGDGSRSIGEIARASYPAEDLTFDRTTWQDLMQSWQIGPNQMGSMDTGRKTAEEANVVQQNFATRIGQERARVASFFLGIVDVLAGLMALYSDFPTLTDEERQQMLQAWDSRTILHDLVFKIRPDSTIVMDSEQRIQRLMRFLNLTAKSGFVNPAPIIAEMAELSGLDPAEVMVQPTDKKDTANISLRLSGKDDLMNSLAVAFMIASGQAPTVEQIAEAKKLQMAALEAPPAPVPPPGMPGGGAAPGPAQPLPPGGAGPAPGVPPVAHNNADHELAPKIAARSRDI